MYRNVVLGLSLIGFISPYSNAESPACPPIPSLKECHKAVAEKFKACSDSVTYMRNVENPEGVQQCLETAKIDKAQCIATCIPNQPGN